MFKKWGFLVDCNRFFENVSQAEVFLNRYEKDLSDADQDLLRNFARLKSAGWIERRKILIKNRILKHGFWRNVGMFLVI